MMNSMIIQLRYNKVKTYNNNVLEIYSIDRDGWPVFYSYSEECG